MSSNTYKVSLESYFKLDIDRMLSSDSLSLEAKETSNSGDVFGEPSEPQNPDGKNSYKKSALLEVVEFEKCQKDFVRRMEAKRSILIEFTEKAAGIYSTKFGELLRKQEEEIDQFNKEFIENVQSELEKWQKCMNYVRQEEEKLIKLLEHLRKVYESPEVQNRRLRKIADMHKVFFKKYEKLIMKHKAEVKSLKDVINEEVQTVKRNLSREFWKKESELMKNSSKAFYSDVNSDL